MLALGDRCYVEHTMGHRLLTKVSGAIPILQQQQLRAKRKVTRKRDLETEADLTDSAHL